MRLPTLRIACASVLLASIAAMSAAPAVAQVTSYTSITAVTAQGEALPEEYVTRIGPTLRRLVDSVATDSSWTRHVYVTARRNGTVRFDSTASATDAIGVAVERQVANAGAARLFTPLPLGWDDSLSLDLHIVHPPAGFPLPDTSGAYFEFEVDRPARAISIPAPAYPAALVSSRAAGRVIMKFIVGLDGRVEPGSVVVIQSTAPEFSEAARFALRDAIFAPAEIKGRKVREVVMMPYVFDAR